MSPYFQSLLSKKWSQWRLIMKYVFTLLFILITASSAIAGESVTYQVNGEAFEGYYVSASPAAPFILLIHDWDGLTDYEVTRANMLANMGYTVFAADLFGAGVRPTEVKDKGSTPVNCIKTVKKCVA